MRLILRKNLQKAQTRNIMAMRFIITFGIGFSIVIKCL